MAEQFDLVVVGGGLGGPALAKSMAAPEIECWFSRVVACRFGVADHDVRRFCCRDFRTTLPYEGCTILFGRGPGRWLDLIWKTSIFLRELISQSGWSGSDGSPQKNLLRNAS